MRINLNYLAALAFTATAAAALAAAVPARPEGSGSTFAARVSPGGGAGARNGAEAAACTGGVVVERAVAAMGTVLRLEVAGADRACALAATEAAVREVARLEGLLSSWDPASEVGSLNASPPGEPWRASPELWSLLGEVRELVALTGGAFDPGVGALVDAWALRGGGRIPGAAELAVARSASGLGLLGVGEAGELTRPERGWWLDTGGFGKGAALRAAGAVLEGWGIRSAVLDFGGQLYVLGPARRVAVAHPGQRAEAMPQLLRVGGGSVSTTSSSERFVTVAGMRLGHVLDPRSGRPVPPWGSVSVVAADPLAADAVSTALFVMGPGAALAWAAAHPEFGVLVQELAGDEVVVRYGPGVRPWLDSTEE